MAYVLIIDDDEDFANAAASVLQDADHEVDVIYDTDDALDKLTDRLPDLVVLDVMFPENPVAGFELARTLRRKYESLPVLMLTAVNQEFPLGFSTKDADAKWLPVAEFLEKPVDFAIFRDKVASLVN